MIWKGKEYSIYEYDCYRVKSLIDKSEYGQNVRVGDILMMIDTAMDGRCCACNHGNGHTIWFKPNEWMQIAPRKKYTRKEVI